MRTKSQKYLVLVGIAIGSVSTYLYQIFIARVLGPVPYGLVASIFAIMGVIGIVASGLSPISAKSTRSNDVSGYSWKFKTDLLFRTTLIATILLAAAASAIAFSAGQYIRLGTLPLLLVSAYIPLAAVFAIAIGRLQGSNRLVQMTWISTGSALLKLLTVIPVYFLALGATGSILLAILSAVFAVAASIYVTKDLKSGNAIIWERKSIITIATLAAFWTLSNSDLVAVKVLSTDEDAGIYAASVSLGRICVVLTMIYVQYRFARFLSTFENLKSFDLKFIGNAMLPVLFLGAFFASMFYFAGGVLVRSLYGNAFEQTTTFLFLQAVLSILISVNFVALNLLIIAEAKYYFPLLNAVLIATTFGYLASGTESSTKFMVILIANIVLFVGFILILGRKHKSANL